MKIVSHTNGLHEYAAEREGFEPPIRLPVCRISSAVLSTTQPPLQRGHDLCQLLRSCQDISCSADGVRSWARVAVRPGEGSQNRFGGQGAARCKTWRVSLGAIEMSSLPRQCAEGEPAHGEPSLALKMTAIDTGPLVVPRERGPAFQRRCVYRRRAFAGMTNCCLSSGATARAREIGMPGNRLRLIDAGVDDAGIRNRAAPSATQLARGTIRQKLSAQ